MSSCQQSGTFWGKPVNPKFNAHRRQQTIKNLGPKYTYLVVKTDDATGKVSSLPYKRKPKMEGYQKIDSNTFIGPKDFVVIYRECWR